MNNTDVKLGDKVQLPKSLSKSKTYPKELIGLVVGINGGYIDVQPMGRWGMAEFYASELKTLERWSGTKKELREYCRKFIKFYNFMINSKGNI